MSTINDYIEGTSLVKLNSETLINAETFGISEAKIFSTRAQAILIVRLNYDFRKITRHTKSGCKKYFSYYYGKNAKWK